MRIKPRFRKSDTDGVKGVDAGSAPYPADHDEAGQTPATSARPANGGTSALLRQAARDRTSRRRMLQRGGTVSAATGAGLPPFGQPRVVVHALSNNPFILGQSNDADATTHLVPTGNSNPNPLFHLNGSASPTGLIVDGSSGTSGIGVAVNGGAAGTGLSVTGTSSPTTIGLAIRATGSGGANGLDGASDSGTGVSGGSNTGTGVSGGSNTGAAIMGASNSGTGVFGTSGTGNAVAGTISNAGSSADAVAGDTAGTGAGVSGTGTRGGDFAGTAAAIRLRPASGPHPASGEIGDLFVDSAGRLFYCRAGGATATWVKLA